MTMTNFFRFLILFVLLSATVLANSPRPVNYVVLLDLSDRLLAPDQARRDAALVQAVFADFDRRVKKQLIINAKDRFRVVIAPQRGVGYQPDAYMESLYLDMSALTMNVKRQRLDALRTELPRQLTRLYAEAMAGKRQPRDFAGSDLWQYANEQLPTDLDPAYDNVLVVLTDGYFDFENNRNALKQGNRATDSRMLDRLRRDPNWPKTLDRPTEGLIPVQKPLPSLTVCVAEIRPKYPNLTEADLLTALWTKWLRESKVRRWVVQQQAGLSKSLTRLHEFLAVS